MFERNCKICNCVILELRDIKLRDSFTLVLPSDIWRDKSREGKKGK